MRDEVEERFKVIQSFYNTLSDKQASDYLDKMLVQGFVFVADRFGDQFDAVLKSLDAYDYTRVTEHELELFEFVE